MHARLGLLLTTVGALVLGAVSSGSAAISHQAGARASDRASLYSPSQVARAFTAAGVRLYNPGYGLDNPVVSFQTASPHQGWTAAVYVYPKTSLASEVFHGNGPGWRKSGVAVAELQNVVVTAVRKGHLPARTQKSFPMPQVMLKGLALLHAGRK